MLVRYQVRHRMTYRMLTGSNIRQFVVIYLVLFFFHMAMIGVENKNAILETILFVTNRGQSFF